MSALDLELIWTNATSTHVEEQLCQILLKSIGKLRSSAQSKAAQLFYLRIKYVIRQSGLYDPYIYGELLGIWHFRDALAL